ncbi:MAG TPA: GNAT family N-acetyltransferase [Bryobacteraceae bacterium]|nr:GNAT family N-acetyltransferase [Bryobacteraceae bacterium]
MSSKLQVRYLTEGEYGLWNNLVAASPEGSIYAMPEYLDVLCTEADAQFRILVAERSGEIVGGLPLFERRNWCGSYVMGRLLLYYCGFILKPHPSKYPSERTSRSLEVVGALEEALRRERYGRVELKSRHTFTDTRVLQERGWRVWPSYSYLVPLRDLDTCWSRIEQNLRRLINRCETQGVTFHDDDDFESFYRLHELTHQRKGAALYLPRENFRRYFQKLRRLDLARLFHARTADGRVMSSQMVLLGAHPVCHTISAAADPEFLKSGATAFLRWRSFQQISQLGYEANDLTDAQLNSVTHFKSQFGGDLVLNLILRLPDRPLFQAQAFVLRAGSFAKRRVRNMITALRRLPQLAPQPQQ